MDDMLDKITELQKDAADMRVRIDATTARFDQLMLALEEADRLSKEWQRKHDERHRWFNFMMAALSSGSSPKRACRYADAACAMFNGRFGNENGDPDEG